MFFDGGRLRYRQKATIAQNYKKRVKAHFEELFKPGRMKRETE